MRKNVNVIESGSKSISHSVHEALIDPFYKNKIFGQVISRNPNPELHHETNVVMQEIDDLKIKSSSVIMPIEKSFLKRDRSIKEKLFDACANAKILTSSVSMYLKPEFRNNLFSQLDLIHDPEDWDTDDIPVEGSSFNTFLRWYLSVFPERGPGIGLSSSGNLIAAWIENKDRLIIEFLPKDMAKWMITKYIDNDIERASGQAKIPRLDDVLSPYGVQSFFRKKI